MNIRHKNLLATILSGALSFAAMAVPAKPGVHTMTQADGSTLKILLTGDEWNHQYLTEDGMPLAEDNGNFRYLRADADGTITLSPMKAADISRRTPEARAWLATADATTTLRNIEQTRMAQPSRARRQAMAKSPGLFSEAKFPAQGHQKALVVLVEYQDVKFTHPDPYDYFSRMLNEEGFSDYGGTGSARDFFIESSNGQFSPEFDLYGPITLSRDMSYYGGNNFRGDDINPHWMVIEACQQLDMTVDFSQYDRDGDGKIDNVFVFYAGRGENSGGGADTVWPHSYNVTAAESTPFVFDGVTLDYYACSNEWDSDNNRPDGVGTFVHEFGHVLGLPDLYATSYTSAFTPGEWSVMDVGSYNNNGCTPPAYSAFERYALGWLTPHELTGPANIALRDISSNNACIIKTADENEFYLFENRQQKGWDTYIPGHGMLAWHIHYSSYQWLYNTCNNNATHQYIDIVEADGLRTETTRDGDSFPGAAGVTAFGDDTSPAMSTWCGTKLGLPLTEITEKGDIITFKVAGGVELLPDVTLHEATDIAHDRFTASWDPVEGAETYQIEVYTVSASAGGDRVTTPVEGFSPYETGNSTTCQVNGLTPATDYCFRVTAFSANSFSRPSEEMAVTTGDPTFEYLSPVALDATDVTDTSFTACWDSFDEADGYLLEVYTKTFSEPDATIVDFTRGLSALPEGWGTNSNMTLQHAGYAGKASPSLWLRNDGHYLETPVFTDTFCGISFWHRGIAAETSNRLSVTVLIGQEWIEIASLPIVNADGGATTTLETLPAGSVAARITYEKNGSGTVAIDDIEALHGGIATHHPLDSYNMLRVGDTHTYAVNGLTPATDYFYRVTAMTADGLRSLPSNEIAVTTQHPGGITPTESNHDMPSISIAGLDITIDNPNGYFIICDIAGRVVANGPCTPQPATIHLPAPGIYIADIAGRTFKLAAR